MADISLCGPIIDRKYPKYKSAYTTLCKKLKEFGNEGVLSPIGSSKIIDDQFTEEERKVLLILSVELVNMQLIEHFLMD